MTASPASVHQVAGTIYVTLTSMALLALLFGMVLRSAGHSRFKHHLTAMALPIRLFAVLVVLSFLLGWWLRHVVVFGPGITGGFGEAGDAWPWAATMGPMTADQSVLGDWLRFGFFSWLVAALVGASLLERARGRAVLLLGMLAGGVCFPICSAWLWTDNGWVVRLTGFHDAFGAGSIHALAGGFALACARVLGPRLAVTRPDGWTQALPAATPWLAALGALFLLLGLVAVAAAALRPSGGPTGLETVGVYGTAASLPGTLAAALLAMAGGLLVGHVLAGGDLTGMLAGGIAAVVAVAAAGDRLHPLQALLLGAGLAWPCLRLHARLATRHGVDDPLGTITLHGVAGVLGVVAAGIVLWTFPATAGPDAARINPLGNLFGAVIAFGVLGYLPGLAAARFLDYLGALRVAPEIELAGADLALALAAASAHGTALGHERRAARDGAIRNA